MIPTCPGCSAEHDPRPCAQTAAMCGCCEAMYASQDERAAACEALDAAA